MSLSLYLDNQTHSNDHKPQTLGIELTALRLYGWECSVCQGVAESQFYVQREFNKSVYNIWRDIDRCFLWVRCCGCGLTLHFDCIPDKEVTVPYLMNNKYLCEVCEHLPRG